MSASQSIMGDSSFPLWHVHDDDNTSFSNFLPYGSWSPQRQEGRRVHAALAVTGSQSINRSAICDTFANLDWIPGNNVFRPTNFA